MVGQIFAGIIGGLIFALLLSFLCTMMVAGVDAEAAGGVFLFVFFAAWVVAIVIAVAAPNNGKAWRRIMISNGLLSLALPVAAFLFTMVGVGEATNEADPEFAGAAAAGALIGGGIVLVIVGLLSVFMATIFLVIGFLCGREQRVIYVQAQVGEQPVQSPPAARQDPTIPPPPTDSNSG